MEVVADATEDAETQLITYLQNILKCQIIPMDYLNLKDLVAEAPKKMGLQHYLMDRYPDDEQFLAFLRKYPNLFTVNSNRTVVLTVGNSFTKPSSNRQRGYDQVDGYDKREYISDSGESEEEDEAERRLSLEGDCGHDVVDGQRHLSVTESSASSSLSESSVDVFSSEIVHTSDSDANSLSSSSSLNA